MFCTTVSAYRHENNFGHFTVVVDREGADDQKLDDPDGRGDDGSDVDDDKEGAVEVEELKVLKVGKVVGVTKFVAQDEKLRKAFAERFESDDVTLELEFCFSPVTFKAFL